MADARYPPPEAYASRGRSRSPEPRKASSISGRPARDEYDPTRPPAYPEPAGYGPPAGYNYPPAPSFPPAYGYRSTYRDTFRDTYREPYRDSYRDTYREPYAEPYRDSYRDTYRDSYRAPYGYPPAASSGPPPPLGGGGGGGDRGGGPGYPAPDSERQRSRVYVGNLPYNVRWTELKDFMRSAGNVLYADVLTLPNGQSKGCGIVEYATQDDAQRAIYQLNESSFAGRRVFVREDREANRFSSRPRPGGPGTPGGEGVTVLVSNLAPEVGWKDLKDMVRGTGVPPLRADVHGSGSGIVVVPDTAAAEKVVSTLNGTDLRGRPVELRLERPPVEAHGQPPAVAPTAGDPVHPLPWSTSI